MLYILQSHYPAESTGLFLLLLPNSTDSRSYVITDGRFDYKTH